MISSTPADAQFQLAEQKRGGFNASAFPASRRGSCLVTRFSRSDMMSPDGSFLQSSSLGLILKPF